MIHTYFMAVDTKFKPFTPDIVTCNTLTPDQASSLSLILCWGSCFETAKKNWTSLWTIVSILRQLDLSMLLFIADIVSIMQTQVECALQLIESASVLHKSPLPCCGRALYHIPTRIQSMQQQHAACSAAAWTCVDMGCVMLQIPPQSAASRSTTSSATRPFFRKAKMVHRNSKEIIFEQLDIQQLLTIFFSLIFRWHFDSLMYSKVIFKRATI